MSQKKSATGKMILINPKARQSICEVPWDWCEQTGNHNFRAHNLQDNQTLQMFLFPWRRSHVCDYTKKCFKCPAVLHSSLKFTQLPHIPKHRNRHTFTKIYLHWSDPNQCYSFRIKFHPNVSSQSELNFQHKELPDSYFENSSII